jgi:hypothetical protein
MTSTKHTTIATRIGQCLAATTLMTGLAIGAAAVASAEREWDLGAYDECMDDAVPRPATAEQFEEALRACCIASGGVVVETSNAGNPIVHCQAPAPEAENVPQPPGQTEPPPVLQNPPAQPSNPLIPTPRGPNSGTLAP